MAGHAAVFSSAFVQIKLFTIYFACKTTFILIIFIVYFVFEGCFI